MAKTLYLIDGHAQIYAAFYAPIAASLTAADGEPTKATYIFTTMIFNLLKERQPDMLAVAMDAPGPTFRHELFDQYKAQRPPMPDDLPPQIDRIEEILTALRVPVLRVGGFEADDILGTVARQGARKGYHVYICSKDKDLEQLLSDQVSMYDPRSDAVLDVAALKENKGISPDQVVDVLALAGDPSDNIPGVPDVGPKTALQWIEKYHNLDQLIEHRDEIKGKRGANLRANLDQLHLSRQLATIDCQMPLEIDWSEFALKSFDRNALEDIFDRLDFHRLLAQLDALDPALAGSRRPDKTTAEEPASAAGTQSETSATYELIDTQEAFDEFLAQLSKQKFFALDTETTGLNPVAADLVGLSFAWRAGRAYYLPVRAPMGQKCLDRKRTLTKLKKVLSDPKIKKTGQNIKYDMVVLRKAGIEVEGVAFDTMVASYVLNSARRHNLDSLAFDYLGHETIKLESLIGKGRNQLTFDMVDTAIAADYAAEDAEVTWRLTEYFEKRLVEPQLRRLYEEVEVPLVQVLSELEYQGVALDVPWLKRMSTQISVRQDELVEKIYAEAGGPFNIDSPAQLAQVLFGRLGLESVKSTKTGRSTDQEVLEALSWQHPIAALMLEYRQLSKLKNTYVDKLPAMICPATGRVHASFNQTVTATGRLSSSNPNLQNIPIRTDLGRQIRKAFVAQDTGGVILAADYSQIELRLLAHFSGDEALGAAFAAGEDIHQFVAAQVYGVAVDKVDSNQRRNAKAVNFGLIYGQSAYGLSRGTGMGMEEARQFIDDYFGRYPGIRKFIDGVISQARKDGYVRTILGRRRVIEGLRGGSGAGRKAAERMAVNTVVQGSAADLIKVAMINIYRRVKEEKLDLKMILQVHDELVFELPERKVKQYSELVQEEMAGAIELKVPVTVDVGWGSNWLECK